MANGKKATKKTHNDIDDLPPEEVSQDFDDESPSDVLGIDIPDSGGDAKADTREEPDERPGDDVLAAVAEEAAEADDRDISEESEEPDEPAEGVSADAEEPGEQEPEQLRTIKFERDGEIVELTVPESEARVLEGYMRAAETTRDKYAHLQDKYLTAIQGAPAQPAASGGAAATQAQPAANQANARIAQMMGAIPQVVDAYTPIVKHVRDSLPEDNELREFIEDQPVIASILAAMWDGQSNLAAQGAVTEAERASSAFQGHVDGLINNIITSDSANEVLADSGIRDKFDEYLVSLGPLGPDGQHDPGPVRATLMRDDGRWLAERWRDFQLRAALTGANPDGGGDTPSKTPPQSDAARRRAIDPGGGSRSGARPNSRKSVFSKDVSDVLSAG